MPSLQEPWTPQRGSQFAFHSNPDTFELLYGGAAGGGKSDSLLVEALRYVDTPGYRGILFRRTFPELEKSLVPRTYEFLSGIAKPSNKGTEWKFPNGSVLYLTHLQHEEDKEKHKSAEYDYAGFDELTSFSETQYVYIFSRVRGKNDKIVRRVRAATNPTGSGHGWVKERFINHNEAEVKPYAEIEYEFACGWRVRGRVYTSFNDLPENYQDGDPEFSNEKYLEYKERKSGLTRAFIPALLWGNSKLLKADPTYVQRLKALPHKQQKALLYGEWDVFEGQFFSEWDPITHVEDLLPKDIPVSWRRFVSIDYGYHAPFCALWGAVDNDGVLHIYRELYATRLSAMDQAEQIKQLTKEEEIIDWYAADPSMFNKQGTGESIAQIYDRHGLALIPSNNSRPAGWAIMHDYLMSGQVKISRACTNLIRTLPSLNFSPKKPDDLDTMQEDHAADALRYMLLTLRGFKSQERSAYRDPTIPEWWDKVQEGQKRRTGYMRMSI